MDILFCVVFNDDNLFKDDFFFWYVIIWDLLFYCMGIFGNNVI